MDELAEMLGVKHQRISQLQGRALAIAKLSYKSYKEGKGANGQGAASSPIENKGGIDFNPNNLDLQTQGGQFIIHASRYSTTLYQILLVF